MEEAYRCISDAASLTPLNMSAISDTAGSTGLWFSVLIGTLAVASIGLSLLVPCWLAQEQRVLPAPVFEKRDQKKIGRLVLPETAVKRKQEEDTPSKSKGIVDRVWLATFGGGHSWDSFEMMMGPGAWADDFSPILVFVNGDSGGRQGAQMLQQLRALLHHLQVVDLREEAPEAALQWWSSNIRKYRILVGGGDGTVGWVLGALETLHLDYMPPVGILPLGTGNDLARTLGWGGGFQGGGLITFLRQVAEARVSLLDRWSVVRREVVPPKRRKSSPISEAERQERQEGVASSMNNYFGIGLDAAIALDFHRMRERRPELFFSRLVNKMWYARNGFLAYLRRSCTKLHTKVTIVCDGIPLKLPRDLEGVVVLNIQSFAGGTNLWGTGEESEDTDTSSDWPSESDVDVDSTMRHSPQFMRPSAQDQRLEVVGITSLRLGAAQVGLAAAKRLAQASTVKIYNQASLPMQIDGEPFLMEEGGEVEIGWKGEAFMLARSSEHADTIATDVIDWALHRSIIDVKQRNELVKETARRMQQSKMKVSMSSTSLASSFSRRASK